MSRSLSFVQPTARVRHASAAAWCRFLTGLKANQKRKLSDRDRGRPGPRGARAHGRSGHTTDLRF
jgi:hypothetical protein